MSTPYIGEIRILPYMRGAPSGWLVCNGSLQQISQYETLFTLLGTAYGGDGNSTFGLPDLRSRVPVHQGQGTGLSPRPLGLSGGTEAETINTQQMGPHVHLALASTGVAAGTSPANMVPAAIPSTTGGGFYAASPQPAEAVGFPQNMLIPSGGGAQHDNTAPTLTMQFCIATDGVWPSQP